MCWQPLMLIAIRVGHPLETVAGYCTSRSCTTDIVARQDLPRPRLNSVPMSREGRVGWAVRKPASPGQGCGEFSSSGPAKTHPDGQPTDTPTMVFFWQGSGLDRLTQTEAAISTDPQWLGGDRARNAHNAQ